MNRAISYLFIAIGAVLGYIGSYFGQPGLMRAFASLGDYVCNARDILFPPQDIYFRSHDEQLTRSVFMTAWIGILVGVVLMAGIVFFIDSIMKRTLKKHDDAA